MIPLDPIIIDPLFISEAKKSYTRKNRKKRTVKKHDNEVIGCFVWDDDYGERMQNIFNKER